MIAECDGVGQGNRRNGSEESAICKFVLASHLNCGTRVRILSDVGKLAISDMGVTERIEELEMYDIDKSGDECRKVRLNIKPKGEVLSALEKRPRAGPDRNQGGSNAASKDTVSRTARDGIRRH